MILLPLLVASSLALQDADADGFTSAGGDCCDSVALINPGAYDVPGNGIDEDCSGAADDELVCSGASFTPSANAFELAEAMELCKSAGSGEWGLLSATLERTDGSLLGPSLQASVHTAFGTGILPQAGSTFVGLSTGIAADANDPGFVPVVNGTDWGANGNPPTSYLLANGGILPASAGCSGACPSGSGANDSVVLHLSMRTPTNATGVRFDFAFLSAEYMTWQCTIYNDFALVLADSGTTGGVPLDGNVIYDTLNNPVSVNNGFIVHCTPMTCNTCPGGTAPLNGTGYEGVGGYTGWIASSFDVIPGDVLDLRFMVFDVSDRILDSMLFLDAFEWILEPTPSCAPGTDICSGDGGDQVGCTDCPCANNAPQGTVGGCLNSAGTSTRLLVSGTSSVAAADLRFEGSGAPPNNSAVLTSGNALAPANMANPCFGLDSGVQSMSLDGLRCAVQNVLRHGVRPSDVNGDIGVTTNGWGTPNGFFNFGAFTAGGTKHFQIIHRDDAAAICMTGQNTSQATSVTFTL